MKILRKIGISLVLVVALLISSLSGVNKAAAISKTALHKKYISKIKSYNRKFKKDFPDGSVYFRFDDINYDGIDECLIVGAYYDSGEDYIDTNGGTDCAVYTFCKGKVKNVVCSMTGGGTWGGFYFSKSKKADVIIIDRLGFYYNHLTFRKLKNGKLTDVGTCLRETDKNGKNVTYSIDEKQTTKKKFEAYRNKMFGKALRLQKVTSQSLQKIS
jgi:hypothetical protein